MVFSVAKQVNVFWSKLPIRYRGAVVVAIPVTCIVITLAAWVWSRQSETNVRRRIDHTEAIITASNHLLIELLNAETGARGYVVTGDSRFLDPYNQGTQNIPQVTHRLSQLLTPDKKSSQAVVTIEQLVRQRAQLLDQVVQLRRTGRSPAAISPEVNRLLYDGKTTMDAIRLNIDQLQAEEKQLLNLYIQRNAAIQARTNYTLWGAFIISLLGLIAALYLFRRLDRELEQREQLLRENKLLLQAIVTNVVDGVITLDERGQIEIFNETATRLFGYAPSEVIGQSLNQLISDMSTMPRSPIPPQGEVPLVSQLAMLEGRPWQTNGIRKDGSTFPLEISISFTPLDNRSIAIIRDITDFLEAEASLQSRAAELARLTAMLAKTNSALEERNRELEQFAYVASHDLKAPLRAIANLSEWLEEDLAGQLPAENQRQMHLLRGRVHRMEALINGLLEYSRIGRSQAPSELVHVEALLHEVIDSLAPPDSFTITIQPGMPTFTAKRLLLRQVFANLIGNAIKHHDRTQGQISIFVDDQGDRYEFAVADDGPGIESQYHDKIFMIFQTLEARDTKESTGIGLSIVKKIVETEGGDIRVDSTVGQGTTFYFTWPK